NDTPVRTGGSVADLAVAEDAASTSLGLGGLVYTPGGGADEAGQVLTYSVTAVPATGLGRIVLADGSTVAAGSYTLADLRGMRFVAAADAVGSGTFSFSVSDGGGGNDTLLESLQVGVNAVNDAPVRTAGTVADLTVAEDSASVTLGLGGLAYGPGGGADEAGQGLGYSVSAVTPATLGRIVLADGSTVGPGSY